MSRAAVFDFGVDVEMIMRLWNALSEADPDLNLNFQHFYDIEAALRCVEVAPEVAFPVIDETMKRSAPLRSIPSNAGSSSNA